VERVAGDEELDALPPAHVRSHDDSLGFSTPMQQEHLKRVAEVIMIELVIENAVQPNRRAGRHHEVKR
jgi:hypothetical protein